MKQKIMDSNKKLVSVFLLALVLVLCGMLWPEMEAKAASDYGLQGSGTEADPYQIDTAERWKDFALMVNIDNVTYGNKYYKLTADITVSTDLESMIFVGQFPDSFTGHFDGGGHTLTFNWSGLGLQYAAPFRSISSATIKNLHVTGRIAGTSNIFSAGIAGHVSGTSYIENCTSSITIECSGSQAGRCGGIVGGVWDNSTLYIKNCVFNGSITGSVSSNCGGLVGYNFSTVQITDCLCAPAVIGIDSQSFYSFVNPTASFSRSYRTYDSGNSRLNQGTRVYAEAPADQLTQKIKAADGKSYWAEGTAAITGLESTYPLTGASMSLPTCTVTFNGTTLNKGTDYTVQVTDSSDSNVSNITSTGTYTLTVTGMNSYTGSISESFIVYTGNSKPYAEANGTVRIAENAQQIKNDTTSLTSGFWYVSGNVTVSERISTIGNTSLILCDGATLTAEKGIAVTNENSLTIYAQSGGTGKLVATGEENNAAIGGTKTSQKTPTYGNITINGGVITATGGERAAAIGGACRSYTTENATITINGGTITASATIGAGIGGGNEEGNAQTFAGTVIINGGRVKASSSDNVGNVGANIGAGKRGHANVTINGGYNPKIIEI